jgi:Zinc carboxypeptidase/Cytosolic carboxypeptidase N-terminal domain
MVSVEGRVAMWSRRSMTPSEFWESAASVRAPQRARSLHPRALRFESRFEGGNLRAAVRTGPRAYELVLDHDTNTSGHTQWFFFRVAGMETAVDGAAASGPSPVYELTVVNLEKGDSSYNHGMRPVVYLEGRFSDEEVAAVWRHAQAAGPASRCLDLSQGAVRLWGPPLPGDGWRRMGHGIIYYPNEYSKRRKTAAVRPHAGSVGGGGGGGAGGGGGVGGGVGGADEEDDASSQQQLFSEVFRVAFPPGTTAAWFAYCYPYGLSDLACDIERWQQRADRVSANYTRVRIVEAASEADWRSYRAAARDILRATLPPSAPSAPGVGGCLVGSLFGNGILQRTVLCRSLSGNALPLLTITALGAGGAVPLARRPVVVISARVHPGESNASWMMRGVLDALTSSSALGQALRERVVFKVVPMLNPDGVANGHHRTNLAGLDLNRQWSRPRPHSAPPIFHLRALLLALRRQGRLALCADLHGHSRKRNVFAFGCAGPDDAAERLFAALLANRSPHFSFHASSFKVLASKVDAARVAVCRDAHLVNSFTIEASFAGPDQGPLDATHFEARCLEEFGHHFAAGLLDLVRVYALVPRAARAARLSHVFAASTAAQAAADDPALLARFQAAAAALRARFPTKFEALDNDP